jgi:nucleotide-binding universal stress UspA family protein
MMSCRSPAQRGSDALRGRRSIQRLLFVADAAVAGVEELPPQVRAVIEAAAEIYVITPSLPGRLAWLADDVDGFQHVADERLDTVLGQLRSIGAHADGESLRGSVMTVFTDGVGIFKPDHILLALQSSEHANWQEHGLVAHVERRFGLPVTSYAVDTEGHASGADGPLLLCYDGSADARRAIERAGALFAGKDALVLTVSQPTSAPRSSAWLGETPDMVDFPALDRAAADAGGRVADAGVRIAQHAGLRAQPLAVQATGPVWKTIGEIADRHDASAIVIGSRGLTRVRSMLLGSVSSAVVQHADRPTLVIHGAGTPADGDAPLTVTRLEPSDLGSGRRWGHMSKRPSVTRSTSPDGAPLAGSSTPPAHSRQDAEVEDIVRALRGYRVLTRSRLMEACGAAHWTDAGFRRALARAVSTGRIRRLGEDLYEITEP